MRLTPNKVKELRQKMINDRKELYKEFVNACTHHMDFIEEKDIKLIVKYNYLGGQLDAYTKILQIMQLKVK